MGRAAFEWRDFGRLVRRRLLLDGRGDRVLADVIGVTSTDLSRVCNGKPVSYEKVAAIGQWAGFDPMDFYIPPTENNALQSIPRETVEPLS